MINRDLPRRGDREARGEQRPNAERLQRRRGYSSDIFHIDPALIPDGMSWEWKRKTVFGQEDKIHMVGLRENHWEPVQVTEANRHLVGEGQTGAIERQGMILMQRPKYLTEDAHQEALQASIAQRQGQRQSVAQTPAGSAPRSVAAFQTRSEPLVVPD